MSMRLKRKYIITVFTVAIIAFPIIGSYMLNKVVDPEEIMVTKTEVSSELVTIQGGFGDSIRRYHGYNISPHDHSLFIQIKGSKLPIGGHKDFNISFPNSYGNIDEIYLVGNDNAKRKIWPQP
ncbi:hypothetical protein SAMN05720606_11154 [Paenibacillus polysaccharolyticus]|uniref:Uncharacterized protein n=1 Tax=Paenibacillus polysaccharolyticus TaxID=582692 RepID=A0A1G5JHA1_9BACL|nr:hypothetical protein [Paenibacillus polysaccharolyticus]SCY87726.1 hypothetical protein SAMN05720606_11154 [Paenibacillus polysaccharolyticus]